MKIVIFHYHLNRGGVTSVIANHLQAMAAAEAAVEEVFVVSGGRRADWPGADDPRFQPLPVHDLTLERLDYDAAGQQASISPKSVDELTADIQRLLEQHGCHPDNCLLHFHNHSLGKNLALPGAIHRLALQGYRLLLQIHDFLEDQRGAAYRVVSEVCRRTWNTSLGQQLYPQASQIHYAVLNRRDFAILQSAGVPKGSLHWLPNPAGQIGALPDRASARHKLHPDLRDRRVILYPVRGIRRKNVGEFLLWASLFQKDTTFVISLAPQNPVEQPSYRQWEQQARTLQLPALFDTGGQGRMSFPENLAAADALITTSVAEGFGMVYLESWLAGRPLVGRDIVDITADFKEAGLDLSRLSPQLPVPLEWFDQRQVRDSLANAYQELSRDYGLTPLEPFQIEDQLDRLLEADRVDFAALAPTLQSRAVDRVCQNKSGFRDELLRMNDWMAASHCDDALNQRATIASNAGIVKKSYSPVAIGQRLARVYEMVAGSEQDDMFSPIADEEAIVKSFLDFTRLYPLRLA